MLETGQIKAIVSGAIQSAVCIDDQYQEPYQTTSGKESLNIEFPACLYRSFRVNGKCDLDIYNFKGYDTFLEDQEYLFNNKELLILDWELDPESQVKYTDALKVLQKAVECDYVQFVTLYTQEENINNIAGQVFSYFRNFGTAEEQEKKLEGLIEKTDKFLKEIESDCTADDLRAVLGEETDGYSLYPHRRREIGESIKLQVTKLLPEWKKLCSFFSSELILEAGFNNSEEFYIWYECYKKGYFFCQRESGEFAVMPVKAEVPALLVNNTLVFILNKKGTGTGISPDDVYDRICQVISGVPNIRSLLLSLRLKEVLHKRLCMVGKGLGGLDEKALVYHASNYKLDKEESLMSYIVTCFAGHIVQEMTENTQLSELNALLYEEEPEVPTPKQLAELNCFLTFTDKDKLPAEMHQLKGGDIFRLTSPVEEGKENTDMEYVICITQGCDALRPEQKINYNFAFTGGIKVSKLSRALEKTEEEHFSFLSGNEVVKWNLNFFTLYIKEHIFNVNIPIPVTVNGAPNKLVYIGNQKDIFSQRVINATFNRALRMGVDLPHKMKE